MTVSAWAAATEPILEGVASAYGGSITYQRLAEQMFEQTGFRTRMLLGNWIGQVLGPVQTATLVEGKPPLSSLVVRAETGGVGDGYVNHQNPRGFATFANGNRPRPSTGLPATGCTAAMSPQMPNPR